LKPLPGGTLPKGLRRTPNYIGGNPWVGFLGEIPQLRNLIPGIPRMGINPNVFKEIMEEEGLQKSKINVCFEWEPPPVKNGRNSIKEEYQSKGRNGTHLSKRVKPNPRMVRISLELPE